MLPKAISVALVMNCFMLCSQVADMQRTLFEPGVIATENVEYGSCISRDGTEIFFVRSTEPWGSGNSRGTIYFSRKTEDGWSEPEIASFSGQYDDSDPHLNADGNQLYFVSSGRENMNNTTSDIWLTKRDAGGSWGIPQKLPQPINSEQREWSPRTDSNGNLYFASDRVGGFGQGDLYISQMIEGQLQPPENLGNTINSQTGEWNLDISHKGDMLIYEASGRPENKSPYGDLYISFKKGDKWSVPQNLSDLNTGGSDLYPQYMIKSGLLFYSSSDSLKSRSTNIYMLPFQKRLQFYKQKAEYP